MSGVQRDECGCLVAARGPSPLWECHSHSLPSVLLQATISASTLCDAGQVTRVHFLRVFPPFISLRQNGGLNEAGPPQAHLQAGARPRRC